MLANKQVEHGLPPQTASVGRPQICDYDSQRRRPLPAGGLQGSSSFSQDNNVVDLFGSREPRKLAGPVQFFSKLREAWDLSDLRSAYTLLGYDASGQSHVDDILAGRARLVSRDEKDRIAELFVIRKILFGIFRDRKVENQWLREPQEILGGKCPLDLLLEGSWPNLLRVRQLTELMAGL